MKPSVFSSKKFLIEQIDAIADFYQSRCLNFADGGYYQFFLPSNEVDKQQTQQHLVSSGRLTYNFCTAFRVLGDDKYRQAASHGLDHLWTRHRNVETGSYQWALSDDNTENIKTYGVAFVLLAFAAGHRAGVGDYRKQVRQVDEFMSSYLWREDDQLFIDNINADLTATDPYRGQNANMHCCEAYIEAYKATATQRYLTRALAIAEQITVKLPQQTGNRLWEHFDQNWQADLQFNIDRPNDKYRPWGVQPGHLAEWSKLLLILYQETKQAHLLERAIELFNQAWQLGWDEQSGMIYTTDLDGAPVNRLRYAWAQAETLAAAALLALHTEKGGYRKQYDLIWQYIWSYFHDQNTGTWHRQLGEDNQQLEDTAAVGKTDFHCVTVCQEILNTQEYLRRSLAEIS